ncbi:MAG: tyrosine-type recombinase/integrase [Erysipelotrichaceae bacterium]|nr:tyrosine-type recombinase/integrase [Erysipelotrichaceae bacterium]
MIVIDGKNVYGINKYELKRKNANNEIRYLVKYQGRLKRGFKSSIDAYLFLEDIKSGKANWPESEKIVKERFIEPEKEYTIPEAVEKYLILYKDTVTYGTFHKVSNHFRDVILPNLPDVPINRIKNTDVLEFRSKLNSEIHKVSDKGEDPGLYSTKSKNDILQELKQFLYFAIDNFGVDRSVNKNVKVFKKTHEDKTKKREKEEQIWSLDEYYRFMAALEKLYGRYSPTYGMYLVFGNKGLRLGECQALKYDDLKYENMLIIDESITRKTKNKAFEVVDPKTETGYRKIPIGSGLYSYLMEYMEMEKRLPGFDEKWFVFHRPDDHYKPMAERTLNNHKAKALELIDLRWNTNHQLRHMYNTFLKDQGIKDFDRSRTLGQKDVEINIDIYTHLSPEAIIEITAADDVLFQMKDGQGITNVSQK